MSEGTRFFMFNRKSDWEYKNFINSISFEDDMIVFANSPDPPVFISSSLDCGENNTVWHRLKLKIQDSQNSKINVYILAADSLDLLLPVNDTNKNMVNFNEFLLDPKIDVDVKINVFLQMGAKYLENPDDNLLFDITGRYLWICIEGIIYESIGKIKIKEMKIEFPRKSFIRFLPEIYQMTKNDSFFSRFMAIFQSLYDDIDDKIDYAPSNFDPLSNSSDFLRWIAHWFSIHDMDIWQEDKLRLLVSDAMKLFKIKGTCESIRLIVETYTNFKPILVEYFNVCDTDYYRTDSKTINSLFGDNSFFFTIILPKGSLNSNEDYANLLHIITSISPIDTICNLVILENSIFLSHHSYIGINSIISKENYVLIPEETKDSSGIMMIG
ncbi:MAG: hypothetical protein NkDv07_0711 [Candidatus Improbicoccus devescovinae]|nr:MAG: hypothetical protein NkDv07_0711 [Candidatus Improbicoccus devescovinae]